MPPLVFQVSPAEVSKGDHSHRPRRTTLGPLVALVVTSAVAVLVLHAENASLFLSHFHRHFHPSE